MALCHKLGATNCLSGFSWFWAGSVWTCDVDLSSLVIGSGMRVYALQSGGDTCPQHPDCRPGSQALSLMMRSLKRPTRSCWKGGGSGRRRKRSVCPHCSHRVRQVGPWAESNIWTASAPCLPCSGSCLCLRLPFMHRCPAGCGDCPRLVPVLWLAHLSDL